MPRVLALVLAAVIVPTAARAETVRVQVLPRETIEQRLRLAAKKNSERMATLMRLFTEAGCEDLAELPVKGSRQGNVVCTLSGTSDEVIVVGAHYDSLNGYGMVDNWSGASLLPSLYQSLRRLPRNHTVIFVGFTDEEQGLRGSRAFVKSLDPVSLARIRAMVNVDSIGMTSTKVWVQRSDKQLLAALFAVASSLQLPLGGVDVQNVGDSDSRSFVTKKIPVIDLHSLTQQNFTLIHRGHDSPESLQMGDYYDTYRLLAFYLGYLDTALDPRSDAPSNVKAQ